MFKYIFFSKKYYYIAFIILIFTSAPLMAEEIICPASINVQQIPENQPPAPWKTRVDTVQHYFRGITVFDGPPEQMASLVPDKDSKMKDNYRKAIWTLDSNSSPIWISCDYVNTSVRLERKLPDYKACSAVYQQGGLVIKFECE